MAGDGEEEGAHLVFVYGTLKRGFPNHGVVAELTARGDAALVSGAARTAAPDPAQPHPALVVGPWGVPFLLPLPLPGAAPVSGELLSLSPRAVAVLDRFEGVPLSLYERRPISVAVPAGASPEMEEEVVEAEAYYAHRSYAAEMWRRCGERGVEGGEYTPEAARAYVSRADRPSADADADADADASLLDEVRRFLASRD